jgi:glutaredoxin-like YruB-family protein
MANKEAQMSDKEVKVYSTPACPYCKMVKKFLEDNSIPYNDLNVAEDKAALEDIVSRSGQMGVPVIDIDGELVIGYNQVQLKEKLGL